MKEVIDTYLGIFFMFLLITCSFSCISAAVDARKADDFKTAFIDDMENSDFNTGRVENVFDKIKEINAEAGYEKYRIRLEFYKEDGDRTTSQTVTSKTEFRTKVGDTTGVYMVSFELDFAYAMPLINVLSTHTLMGYAK